MYETRSMGPKTGDISAARSETRDKSIYSEDTYRRERKRGKEGNRAADDEEWPAFEIHELMESTYSPLSRNLAFLSSLGVNTDVWRSDRSIEASRALEFSLT